MIANKIHAMIIIAINKINIVLILILCLVGKYNNFLKHEKIDFTKTFYINLDNKIIYLRKLLKNEPAKDK